VTFNEACDAFQRRDLESFGAAADAVIAAAHDVLTVKQIARLASSVADSGDKVSIPQTLDPLVDVPSSGGPASLTTLLSPLLVATFRFHVPKLSATGSVAGGIDTFAVLPGFKIDLTGSDFISVLRRCRFAHAAPSDTFCPADTWLVEKRRAANMMENPALAAGSLLAKKLAVPRTRAVFDFRVGPAGNIGNNIREAQSAKRLLLRVAAKLNVAVRVILTDCRTFPSTALGRLESLSLLWQIVSNKPLLAIDREHVNLCIELAMEACRLAEPTLEPISLRRKLNKLIVSGAVKRRLIAHLSAQHASPEGLRDALEFRNSQKVIAVACPTAGYWSPPDIRKAKEWIKREQTRVAAAFSKCKNGFARQIGLRLCHSTGDLVSKGEPVLEIRYPSGVVAPRVPQWLGGLTSKSKPRIKRQLLGYEKDNLYS
jgi:thymidine phosphorylase